MCVSSLLQVPSPHSGVHTPQSAEHVEQVSPYAMLLQIPSPQFNEQAPQSPGQE